MRYKDLSTIQSDSYYSIAENILEEPEIDFIFAGVREHIDELLSNTEKYNIKEEDIEDFIKIFLIDANEFYEEFLYDSYTFDKLDILKKIEIIYLFFKEDLPKWIYEETEFKDDHFSNDEDNNNHEPYDVDKIDIISNTYQAEYLLKKYKLGELKLSPDFQRKFVWTPKQKSRLIESILIKIPLPIFYIDARNDDQWVVIDGLQRLTTIFSYLEDGFKLSSMEYLTQLNKSKFTELERKHQRKIEDLQLQCNFIRPNTPADIAFNIFQRINTLGTKLEIQEIRNAMYMGESTELLTRLSKSNEFIKIVTKKKMKALSKRMDDHATILRYLAFKITNYSVYNKNNMNDFLSSTMEKINSMSKVEIRSLENTFIDCMAKANILFNKDSFMKPSKQKKNTNKISKTLFESIGYTLDKYSLDEIKDNQVLLLEKIYETYKDNEFMFKTSIATNNPPHVHYRFEKFQEIFKNVIGY